MKNKYEEEKITWDEIITTLTYSVVMIFIGIGIAAALLVFLAHIYGQFLI